MTFTQQGNLNVNYLLAQDRARREAEKDKK
jgi:hypothetical protein